MDNLNTLRFVLFVDEEEVARLRLLDVPSILLKRAVQTTILEQAREGRFPMEDLFRLCRVLCALEEKEETDLTR